MAVRSRTHAPFLVPPFIWIGVGFALLLEAAVVAACWWP